jgi:serine O-acetyltransferase
MIRLVKLILSIPAIIIFLCLPKNHVFFADLKRWKQIHEKKDIASKSEMLRTFCGYFTYYPELRSLFYYRVKAAKSLAFLMPPMAALYICTDDIGPGLYIEHGFATILSAKKIGANFWVNQQVTVGYTDDPEPPSIGDNVRLSAGAKVLGNVTIGNNSIIGANAVVVKDIPENCTAVGIPAVVIRQNGVPIQRLSQAGANPETR